MFSGRVLAVAVSTICLAAICIAPSARADKEIVRIGVIAPLTGSQAAYGEDLQRVSNLLVPELNKKSEKYTFQVLQEDGKCGIGNDAVTAAQKLTSVDQVRFLVVACSGEVFQIAPLLERGKALMIGTAATHPDISALGKFVFRTSPDISQGVEVIIPRMRESGRKKFAIVTEESAFTAGILKVMQKSLGSEIVSSQTFPPNEADLRPILTKAIGSGADAIYLNAAAPATFQNAVKLLRAQNVKVPLFAYHQPSEVQNQKSLGTLQDGIEFFDVAPSENPPELFVSMMQEYQKTYASGATVEWLARTAFDALQSVVEAIDEVGPDPEKVSEALVRIHRRGALGELRFSSAGDSECSSFKVFRMRDGRQIPVSETISNMAQPERCR